jgi:tetratricopeptide (TPR) repeat protein
MLVRLVGDELTAIFRIVPRVLGKVEGASVMIRQNHATLADITLEMKVVQRTWVVFSGAMTFIVPGLSAILKHFGLDFESQREAGFSFYMAVARLVFDKVSPLGLTIGLGLVTGLLWWFTRPRIRDVFWDIETTGPEEKLRRIVAAKEAGEPESVEEIMALLKAFPEYQPARLFYADWHYEQKSYKAALRGYERAFKLGVTKARYYQRASRAASSLDQIEQALHILQMADQLLPPNEMNGVMLYNKACYHARLGQFDEAIACLPRAMRAGYKKRESYENDRDLDPLRGRDDFKRLLSELNRV